MGRWKNEDTWNAIIDAAAERYGVPAALVRAVIATESQFTPGAYRPEPKINDGSAGLMQILLGTARGTGYLGPLGDKATLTGLFDPATNIDAGTAYLAKQYDRAGGDIRGAASAYNGGWNPSIGFGLPADHDLTIVLARDTTTGEPIKRRAVKTGEYANKPYVDAVISNYAYFQQKQQASGSGVGPIINPLPPTGTVNPKLVGLLGGALAGLLLLRSRQRRRRR